MRLGLILTVILAGAVFISQAEALPVHVSINLSDACKSSPKCPSVDDLIKYDTSDQKKSGKFVDGKREKPPIRNHWLLYKSDAVFVEPEYDMTIRTKQIIIEPPGHMWYKLTSDKTIKDNTIIDYHNRYIFKCQYARIVYDPVILEDTINYFKSGCTADLQYQEKQVTKRIDTKHNFKESQKYKLEAYQKWVKENCLKKRNACTDIDFNITTMERDAPLKR